VPGLRIGDQEYQFCKLFVIEAAIHLAELDFDHDLESMVQWHRMHRQPRAVQPGSTSD